MINSRMNIINFLGCPRSGKTTIAALLFANLKQSSFHCEFVTEQARYYIAQKRLAEGKQPTENIQLSDEDQYKIMKSQLAHQTTLQKASGGHVYIVTDSSPLNSTLYMTEDFRNSKEIKDLIEETLSTPTLYFYSKPVTWNGGVDPNRIHSEAQSLEIDRLITSNLLPSLQQPPIVLSGDLHNRTRLATTEVLHKIMGKING